MRPNLLLFFLMCEGIPVPMEQTTTHGEPKLSYQLGSQDTAEAREPLKNQ
jgi:hypothetical protein